MRPWIARCVVLALAALPSVAAPVPQDSDLRSLAWMAGTWTGTADGTDTEEVWIAPKGGTMLGLHRDVANGRTVSFEFLRIEGTPAGAVYWGSPGGNAATPFRQVSNADRRVVFENKDHDFPTRILYWLGQDGALHARIEGTQGGKAASEEWTWRRPR